VAEQFVMAARPALRAQPGFALVATLIALVLVGTFVTIGFYHAPPPGDAPATPAQLAATAAAEAGAHAVMQSWDFAMLTRLPARGDTTIIGRGAVSSAAAADYVVSIGRSGPAQFTITSTGAAGETDSPTYCTVVVRTHLKSGRLAERGAATSRTCRPNV
jgi:hypothetical protein